ncbi:MucR family transcriptional regulator [Methylobacterium sp. V23]|nr:MucR family transcriptional regulator [Methylobacterium sp. V23]
MHMTGNKTDDPVLACSAAVVRSYVANNSLPACELADLLRLVHGSLRSLCHNLPPGPVEVDPRWCSPKAVRASVRPDGIVSFIDGKTYQVLKRHLRVHGLDPDAYRERFGLPDNYPMVAPGFSQRRSKFAKDIGLGTRRPGSTERAPAGGAPSPSYLGLRPA